MSNQWSPVLILGWLFAMIVENIPVLKQMWSGVSTRKEDLKINWEEYEKAERSLKTK